MADLTVEMTVPHKMEKLEKKTKKKQKKSPVTGIEVVENLPLPETQPTYLPTYEDMMLDAMFNGPNCSMEVEPDMEQEYLCDASKPLHTYFILPHQGKRSTCPVYFGSYEDKQTVLTALCSQMHCKIFQEWGNMSCECGLVPSLKLSQTSKNPNKVFLCCPKTREMRCRCFQWIHQPPRPNCAAASTSTLKKRFSDMLQEKAQKKLKVETPLTGGFTYP